MFEAIQKKMKEGCKRFKAAWPELKEEWVDVWRRLVVLAIKIGRLSIEALCLSGKMIGVFFQNESVSNAEEKKEVAVMETMNNLPEINIRNSRCEQEIKEQIKELLNSIPEGCPEDFERIKKRVRKIVQREQSPDQSPHDGVKRSCYDRGTQTIHLHAEVPAEHVQGVLAHWLGRSILHSRKGTISYKHEKIWGKIAPVNYPGPPIFFHRDNLDSAFDQLEKGHPVEYRIEPSIDKAKHSIKAVGVRKICASDLTEEDPDQHRKTDWKDGVEQAGHLIPSRYEDDILADYYGSKWGFGDDVRNSRKENYLTLREPDNHGIEWGETIPGKSFAKDGDYDHVFPRTWKYCVDENYRIRQIEISRFMSVLEESIISQLEFSDESLESHHKKHVIENAGCFQSLCELSYDAGISAAQYVNRLQQAVRNTCWTYYSHPTHNKKIIREKIFPVFVDYELVLTVVKEKLKQLSSGYHILHNDGHHNHKDERCHNYFRDKDGVWRLKRGGKIYNSREWAVPGNLHLIDSKKQILIRFGDKNRCCHMFWHDARIDRCQKEYQARHVNAELDS